LEENSIFLYGYTIGISDAHHTVGIENAYRVERNRKFIIGKTSYEFNREQLV
jgi:hypothetical protein